MALTEWLPVVCKECGQRLMFASIDGREEIFCPDCEASAFMETMFRRPARPFRWGANLQAPGYFP